MKVDQTRFVALRRQRNYLLGRAVMADRSQSPLTAQMAMACQTPKHRAVQMAKLARRALKVDQIPRAFQTPKSAPSVKVGQTPRTAPGSMADRSPELLSAPKAAQNLRVGRTTTFDLKVQKVCQTLILMRWPC